MKAGLVCRAVMESFSSVSAPGSSHSLSYCLSRLQVGKSRPMGNSGGIRRAQSMPCSRWHRRTWAGGLGWRGSRAACRRSESSPRSTDFCCGGGSGVGYRAVRHRRWRGWAGPSARLVPGRRAGQSSGVVPAQTLRAGPVGHHRRRVRCERVRAVALFGAGRPVGLAFPVHRMAGRARLTSGLARQGSHRRSAPPVRGPVGAAPQYAHRAAVRCAAGGSRRCPTARPQRGG